MGDVIRAPFSTLFDPGDPVIVSYRAEVAFVAFFIVFLISL